MSDIFNNGCLCQNCQAPLNIKAVVNGVVTCEYCHSSFEYKKEKYEVLNVNDYRDAFCEEWEFDSESSATSCTPAFRKKKA